MSDIKKALNLLTKMRSVVNELEHLGLSADRMVGLPEAPGTKGRKIMDFIDLSTTFLQLVTQNDKETKTIADLDSQFEGGSFTDFVHEGTPTQEDIAEVERLVDSRRVQSTPKRKNSSKKSKKALRR